MRHQDFNIIFQPPKEATSGFVKSVALNRAFAFFADYKHVRTLISHTCMRQKADSPRTLNLQNPF